VGFLLSVKVQACQFSLEVSAVRNCVLVWKECGISERVGGIMSVVYVSASCGLYGSQSVNQESREEVVDSQ
jgi:hypothetical protein